MAAHCSPGCSGDKRGQLELRPELQWRFWIMHRLLRFPWSNMDALKLTPQDGCQGAVHLLGVCWKPMCRWSLGGDSTLYSSHFARWCMERESGVLLAWLMSDLLEGQFRDILERWVCHRAPLGSPFIWPWVLVNTRNKRGNVTLLLLSHSYCNTTVITHRQECIDWSCREAF